MNVEGEAMDRRDCKFAGREIAAAYYPPHPAFHRVVTAVIPATHPAIETPPLLASDRPARSSSCHASSQAACPAGRSVDRSVAMVAPRRTGSLDSRKKPSFRRHFRMDWREVFLRIRPAIRHYMRRSLRGHFAKIVAAAKARHLDYQRPCL